MPPFPFPPESPPVPPDTELPPELVAPPLAEDLPLEGAQPTRADSATTADKTSFDFMGPAPVECVGNDVWASARVLRHGVIVEMSLPQWQDRPNSVSLAHENAMETPTSEIPTVDAAERETLTRISID
jgi:hypothetical protein